MLIWLVGFYCFFISHYYLTRDGSANLIAREGRLLYNSIEGGANSGLLEKDHE